MGYHVGGALTKPVSTITAVLYSTMETEPVNGVVVRTENILPLPSGLRELWAGESDRVSKNQVLAVTYQSQQALEQSRLLDDLLAQRELLSYIETHSAGVMDAVTLDSKIKKSIATVLTAVENSSVSTAQRVTMELRSHLYKMTYFFSGEDVLSPKISALDAQINSLESSSQTASTALRADEPGLFSSSNDGLESVWTQSAIDGISVEEFNRLISISPSPPDAEVCRLIRGWTWSYVFLMPAEKAWRLGKTVKLRFSDGFECSMALADVSEETDGVCAVVLESSRYIARFLSARDMRAEILFGEYTGVRIPQNGLRYSDEDGYYVYCVIVGSVKKKKVEIIGDIYRETYYLSVYTPENRSSLLPNDEIIVAGKNLFDGKSLR